MYCDVAGTALQTWVLLRNQTNKDGELTIVAVVKPLQPEVAASQADCADFWDENLEAVISGSELTDAFVAEISVA
jgi:hypothetical protein